MNFPTPLLFLWTPIIFTFFYFQFQLRCTGTFYDQWSEEPRKIDPHLFIYACCFITTFVFTIITKIADYKWEQSLQTGPSNRSNTNLSGKKVHIFVVFVCIWIFISRYILLKPIRDDPLQANKFPYKILLPIKQLLMPNVFIATYTILLISKSPKLKDKIKSFMRGNVLHPEIIVV